MSDLQTDLPALLGREARTVLVPPLSGIRARSRHRRQRRGAALAGALAVIAAVTFVSLPTDRSHPEQVAVGSTVTLDLYPQARPNPVTLRTSGDPVLHLTVVRAEVTRDTVTNQVVVMLGFDAASQKEFSAIGPGEQVAFVVSGEVVSAPLFQAHIFGDAQLTGQFTVEQATRLAHRLTDNVVVNAG